VIWPLPMHQRGLKTRLESPEFKAVREGHAGACATQVPLWRPAANSCSRDGDNFSKAMTVLFGSERHHGINAHGSPRGHVGGKERDNKE
jgi:hypothetical protein